MKKWIMVLLCVLMTGCSTPQNTTQNMTQQNKEEITIELSDSQIVVSNEEAVTISHDIVYYEAGHDETYGEGDESDAHTQQEADLHTVVTIRKPGTYRVSGTLSYGQIAIDLDEESTDPVNLILDGIHLTCTVAPAIIVYDAYECAEKTKDNPDMNVDLSDAGFNLIIEHENVISGAYVAKIYEPGTEEKLHKYDAAIESLVSLTISGEGSLSVNAANEGIETKMHMHIQSGDISISSSDDSLNASEDGVSVIRISGGNVICDANQGEEGDGIDSNGWLIIEGGSVSASGNEKSMDSGLDSDNGILIHGGTVVSTGNMLDEISADSKQNVVILQSMQTIPAETMLMIKQDQKTVFKTSASSTVLVVSSPDIKEGATELWQLEDAQGIWYGGILSEMTSFTEKKQLSGTSGQGMNRPGRPQDNFNLENMPEGMQPGGFGNQPEGEFAPENMPEGMQPGGFGDQPEGEFNLEDIPGGFDPEQMPQGEYNPDKQEGYMQGDAEFTVLKGITTISLYGTE